MNLTMFNQLAKITDHLYLSSAAAVTHPKLIQNGITHVINVTMEMPNIAVKDVQCIQIHVDDMPGANLRAYFDRCADKVHHVHKRGGRTLIHCVAGVSRSASLCMVYLMKYHRMRLLEAYYHVKGRRPVIRPNPGFWKQMVDYERQLFGSNSVQMVPSSIGLIPSVYKEESRNMVWFPSSSSSMQSRSRKNYY